MIWKEEPRDWIWTGPSRHIAEEIKVQMIRRNIHQTDVADMLSMKRQALSRRLRGQTPWHYSELNKLRQAWNMTDWELTGVESPLISTTVATE